MPTYSAATSRAERPGERDASGRLSRAVAEAGIAVDQSLIGHGTFTMESSAAWFDRLLASSDPPTGLACANELGLLGALHVLGKRGLAPGSDVHIVTRDSTRLARFLPAKIDVHSVDMAAVGRTLVEVLERRITNPIGPAETILFKGEIRPWPIGGMHEQSGPLIETAALASSEGTPTAFARTCLASAVPNRER
ncbi:MULTISPECIES: substrate-binding domain-containing protein [unclassified Mesorhizobium]|uniref:substrate-binding domain-containing protein n=1 Tax=unclassified Mesorhizobium TaxID=325217 RepID=UPI001CCE752C|nr:MULTISPECIES: substrate-binding domain-containing protein [unclassified Mesorhizobium]MBZ9739821.1 substrate-binding domain-containing protein [Mesorhizobium sp. CO1-1-4]MBZ9805632.1 substrate-binding domain-containing protein [Mesorhizobium sp. ES1-6]